MTDNFIVFTTYPDAESALGAAKHIVRQKLAACVNVLPQMTSVYEWQGEARTDTEHLLLMKTTAARYPALESAIRDSHPYELPEIIATPIARGLEGYLEWIAAQTTA
ncbi:MAG: divalent-cation tolerance protein CutA [Gammaproteobacteria bacterium]|nr:divalent-cation tolerance protein CutA [Gammaproteobacteria bacterium]